MSEDETDLEERLEAWGAFWRWRNEPEQAGSFEGQFRSKQPWDALPVTPAWLDIDHEDVQAIESAVCALDLFHHILLKTWYVRRWSEDGCMQAARSAASRRTRGSFRKCLAEAKALLLAELERPAVVRKQRASDFVRELLGLEPLTAPPIKG